MGVAGKFRHQVQGQSQRPRAQVPAGPGHGAGRQAGLGAAGSSGDCGPLPSTGLVLRGRGRRRPVLPCENVGDAGSFHV